MFMGMSVQCSTYAHSRTFAPWRRCAHRAGAVGRVFEPMGGAVAPAAELAWRSAPTDAARRASLVDSAAALRRSLPLTSPSATDFAFTGAWSLRGMIVAAPSLGWAGGAGASVAASVAADPFVEHLKVFWHYPTAFSLAF